MKLRAASRSALQASVGAWAVLSTPIAGPEGRWWRVLHYGLLAMVAYLVAWCWWLTLRHMPTALENLGRAWRS